MNKRLAILVLLASTTASTGASAAPPPPDKHFVAGVVAFQSGAYDKAIVELKASLDAAPTSKAALYLGNAYLKLGQLEAARDALALALKLEPEGPKAPGIRDLIDNIDARTGVKITVTSTPPGAAVYIDSRAAGSRGTTPVEFPAPLGRHQVLAVLDGYETATQDQEIAAGAPIKIDLTLRVPGCDLSLSAETPGSRASVDGAAPVALPAMVRVNKGDHKVTVTADNAQPKELVARCDASGPIALATSLTATGKIKLADAVAPGTIVTIDGKVVDMTPADATAGLGLPAGHHVITVAAPDKAPWTTTVDVGAGAEVPVVAPPATEYQSLYAGLDGAGNVPLRSWHLGSNSFVSQDGSRGIYPSASPMAGLHVGYRIIPRLAVEGEIYWLGLPNQLDSGSQGLSYDANVLFSILKGKWTPTVEGGLGAYQVVAGELGSDVSMRGHLGAGLRGPLTDWLSLRVDVRDVVSRGFDSLGANNVEAMAGVEIVVWQRRPAPAPVLTGRN
jgi:hypothetical protein